MNYLAVAADGLLGTNFSGINDVAKESLEARQDIDTIRNADDPQKALQDYKDKKEKQNKILNDLDSKNISLDKDGFLSLESNTQPQSTQNTNLSNLSPNAQDTMGITQELQNATQPQYYRNTGIEYFDRTKDLTLGDIFLAKQLGLNLQRIDLNVNMKADVRTRDINKAFETTTMLNNATDQLTQGLDTYVDEKLHRLDNNIARSIHGNASWWPIGTDNAREMALNEARITAAATINSNNPRGITQKEKDQARDIMNSTWATKKGLLGKVQGNLETARNKKQENINRLLDKDINVPDYFYVDLDIQDKMIETLNDGKYDAKKAAKLRSLRQQLQNNAQNPKVLNEIILELHKM